MKYVFCPREINVKPPIDSPAAAPYNTVQTDTRRFIKMQKGRHRMRVECQAEAAGLRYVLYKEAEPIGQALLADGCLAGLEVTACWRGRGYGKEGCKAALEWQKRELGLPVYARIHRENTASQRLAASLGFVREREPDLENEGDILHYKMP